VTPTPATEPFARARISLPARASAVFLGGGALAVGAYFLMPADTQDVWYIVIGAASVTAVAASALRLAHARRAWMLFAGGLACSLTADAISSYYELAFDKEPPVPSAADVFYLASYPLLLAGIVLLLRELGAVKSRVAALDAVIVATAVGMIQWIFFVEPYRHADISPLARGVGMTYPTMDLLMLVALVQLLLAATSRRVSYQLLVLAVSLWVVGDEIFGLSVDDYSAGGWVDVFWLGSYVLWGAAALDPSAAQPAIRDRREVPRLTSRRLTLLAGALLAVPAVILIEHFWRSGGLHPGSIALGAALLAVLVVLRFAGLVRAVEGARAAERAANERLREVDRLKDEFISTVSHELRTPLTSITGYVELAREQADPEAARFLEIVQRNAGRLLELVNDLLLVARIQGGRLEIEVEQVDVRELAAESVASAQPQAARRAVELVVRRGDGTAEVLGDRRRLIQVFDNLVSNAIKFSSEGGRVDVAVGRRGEEVVVEVTDAGIGMTDEERGRLFERFFRTRGALDRQIPGTGLGLYITRHIVEAHGGAIDVRSVDGQGSTFAVRLPVAA
jgi:signal transduction histidine kinase